MRLALYTIQLLMYTNEAHGLVPGGVELNCAYMGMHVHEIIKNAYQPFSMVTKLE